MVKMKNKTLATIGLIFAFCAMAVIFWLVLSSAAYISASSICIERGIRPVRYEYSGFFNQKNTIITTEENADTYKEVCIKSGNPPSGFSITKNLQYTVEHSK